MTSNALGNTCNLEVVQPADESAFEALGEEFRKLIHEARISNQVYSFGSMLLLYGKAMNRIDGRFVFSITRGKNEPDKRTSKIFGSPFVYQSLSFSYPSLTSRSPATFLKRSLCSSVKCSRQLPVLPERKVRLFFGWIAAIRIDNAFSRGVGIL